MSSSLMYSQHLTYCRTEKRYVKWMNEWASECTNHARVKDAKMSNSLCCFVEFSSLIAQLVKNLPAMQETLVWFLGQEDHWRGDRLPTPVFLGFPGGSAGKELACNAGDLGSVPGLGRSPGEGKGYPLQYSGLENSMGCISLWGRKELDTTERLWHSDWKEKCDCWEHLWKKFCNTGQLSNRTIFNLL